MDNHHGVLVLADGTVFEGTLRGAGWPVAGVIGFTTNMTGYLELLTDPCSAGMLLCFTYPVIGAYGVKLAHGLSTKAHACGLIVRECCPWPSHFEIDLSLQAYLEQQGVTMLENVDTRALTRHIRQHGTQRGVIFPGDSSVASKAPDFIGASPTPPRELPSIEFFPGGEKKVVVMHLGAVDRLVQDLHRAGYTVLIFPDTVDADEILKEKPDALILSEGPETLHLQNERAPLLQRIRCLAETLPVLGIGVGHLLLAEAFRARIEAMPWGHRGSNHSVRRLGQSRIEVTRQNHGYAVVRESLEGTGFEVSHEELHDKTVEGLRHTRLPLRSLQYYSDECAFIMQEFLSITKEVN